MWICLNDGFLSIVKDRAYQGHLLVRARRKQHLGCFLGSEEGIKHTPMRDYAYRISLPKEKVVELLAKKIREIEYGNFKDSVGNDGLHDMYAAWWGDHRRLQESEREQSETQMFQFLAVSSTIRDAAASTATSAPRRSRAA